MIQVNIEYGLKPHTGMIEVRIFIDYSRKRVVCAQNLTSCIGFLFFLF